MTLRMHQPFLDIFPVMHYVIPDDRQPEVCTRSPSRSDLEGSAPALDRVGCTAFQMTDLSFQLIAHQALSANGHCFGASCRRRTTCARQECSPQPNVDLGRQLSVGRLFVACGVVCAHDERKDDVEARRSLNLPAYGGIAERVCTSSSPPNRILTPSQPVSGDFEARKVPQHSRLVGPLGILRGKASNYVILFFFPHKAGGRVPLTCLRAEQALEGQLQGGALN